MFRNEGCPVLVFRAVRAVAVAAALAALDTPTAAAPAATGVPTTVELTFNEFMTEVAASNLDYAVQRYSVSIAEAQLAAAKIFLPNPQAQLGYSQDITRGRPRSDQESVIKSGGFVQTIPVGGKRGARVDVARHALLAASATLEEFLRNLRIEAAAAFIDARAKLLIAERKRLSAESFDQVASLADVRLRAGDAGQADALQARVDARQFRSEYLAAESDAEAACIGLSQLLGSARAAATIRPKADLEIPAKTFVLTELMAAALQKRPDIIAAREAKDAASASARLARANRIPDPGVGLTYTRTGASNNVTAPYDKTDTLQASVSFELPVFTHYQHELESARYAERQAERQLDAAILKAQVDVRSAEAVYRLATERVAQYRDRSALRDAEEVLKARRFSYERGAASLLDVLQAQRDLNDVYLNYYDALSAYATARVTLEQAAALDGATEF